MVALLTLALAISAAAEDTRRNGADVQVFVPVPPVEHQRLHYFGRQDHHLVPGTVTIDKPPYQCDLDGLRFTDRDRFVAHLRAAHHTPPEKIPDHLLVVEGQVHFVGE